MTLAIRIAAVLAAALAAGCEPEAQALCEQKASCYLVQDEETCMSELDMAATNAAMRGCEDAFYTYLDCQVNEVSFTCDDNFDRHVSDSCGRKRCEYETCGGFGFPPPPEGAPHPCDMISFNPAGVWTLNLEGTSYPSCSLTRGFLLDVRVSGDTFQLTRPDVPQPVTGTVQVSQFGASITLTTTASGAEPALTLDLFAQPQSLISQSTITVSGVGTGTFNGCTGAVKVKGQVMPTQSSP